MGQFHRELHGIPVALCKYVEMRLSESAGLVISSHFAVKIRTRSRDEVEYAHVQCMCLSLSCVLLLA